MFPLTSTCALAVPGEAAKPDDELRTLWRTTLRSSPPPALAKDLLARFICWHIQEQALGGLDRDSEKLLDSLARGHKPGADALAPAPTATLHWTASLD
jgi:hypothetical protein